MTYYPGARSILKDPSGIDFVILRENSEGLYPGREGDLSMLSRSLPDYRDMLDRSFDYYGEGKFAIRVVSEKATRRFAEFVCKYALARKNKGYMGKVTCVHKSNVFVQSDTLFEKIVREEVEKYPELIYEQFYVDDTARRLLLYAREMDVLVTTNMFGDILSDESSELIGGLGIAPSGCVGGKVAYFESVSGSAPKYAGKNIINPTATILSAKLMLDYLGMHQESEALERAVAAVYKEGKNLTYDQGGSGTTTEFTRNVLKHIK
jgi:isocitrate/isopropylmalate dehydrogenase